VTCENHSWSDTGHLTIFFRKAQFFCSYLISSWPKKCSIHRREKVLMLQLSKLSKFPRTYDRLRSTKNPLCSNSRVSLSRSYDAPKIQLVQHKTWGTNAFAKPLNNTRTTQRHVTIIRYILVSTGGSDVVTPKWDGLGPETKIVAYMISLLDSYSPCKFRERFKISVLCS
jgi:hypothetical protein